MGKLGQRNGSKMTDVSLDELGPVDYVIVEFPAGASNFTGEMAEELVSLVESGIIRVIDVLILVKDEDGSVEAMELSDFGDLGALEVIEAELAELLAEEDVEHLGRRHGTGKHGGGADLGEPLGGPFRGGGTSFGRAAHRQWSDSDSGNHRLDRGRRRE